MVFMGFKYMVLFDLIIFYGLFDIKQRFIGNMKLFINLQPTTMAIRYKQIGYKSWENRNWLT